MKKTIRKKVLKKRDEIPPEVKKIKDAFVKQGLFNLSEFITAKIVFFYASFRSEVDTLSMIKESLKLGKRIVLPKVDKERHMLKLYEIKDIGELSPGYMGVPEPLVPNERLVSLDDIDLVIIPCTGFDYSGNRLGYGAGYYDILLSKSGGGKPIVALAYEEQLVDSIPAETHDVKIIAIVTDKGVIRI